MSVWLGATAVLLVALIPCGLISARGSPIERLLGFELAGPIGSMALVAMAEGFGRSVYMDVALVFTVVNFVATLAYVRLFEGSV
jgi:multicomponent Na+:H+ antiporter subunit F